MKNDQGVAHFKMRRHSNAWAQSCQAKNPVHKTFFQGTAQRKKDSFRQFDSGKASAEKPHSREGAADRRHSTTHKAVVIIVLSRRLTARVKMPIIIVSIGEGL